MWWGAPDAPLAPRTRGHARATHARTHARSRAGERFVYSDISMISLMFLIGSLARPLVPVSSLDPDCAAAATDNNNSGRGAAGHARTRRRIELER